MQTLYILGASGHANVVADIARALGYEPRFIDKDDPMPEGFNVFVLGMGANRTRLKYVKETLALETLIHPSAIISPSAKIGRGTVVMPGVIANAGAKVGAGVILNSGCIVEHDCKIGDAVHICPRAALAGNVIVEEGAWVGIGSSVIQGLTIGAWSVIGAGAVVVRDVPANVTAKGVPARFATPNN